MEWIVREGMSVLEEREWGIILIENMVLLMA
jgi:hypothetical protein